jgi:DNA-binding beta-propeller fold protein YncE
MCSLVPALSLLSASLCVAQAIHSTPHPVSYSIAVPQHPFGIVTSADEAWVFVGMVGDSSPAGGIAMIELGNGGYALRRVISLSNAATGLAITREGDLLIVAAGAEVYFFDVSGLATGGADAVFLAGSISDGGGAGSIWASVTADDRTLFICDEDSDQITVVNLAAARTNGFTPNSILGTIRLGASPTSIAFSSDGSTAYVTVLWVANQLGWPLACPAEGSTSPALVNPQGAVVSFDVATATSHPSQAVTEYSQFVPARCSPVRVVASPDGRTLYATARNNNEVLALDPSRFASDPMNAIVGTAPVGVAPVPVMPIDNGALIVVGNSNRFFEPLTPQSLDVLDAAQLLGGAGAAATERIVAAGAFPRDLTLSPDGGTLFLSNYNSYTVEAINVLRLAGPARDHHPGPGQ